MKYFIVLILMMNCLVSCAQNSKHSLLFKVCDSKMNNQREELAEQLFEELKIKSLIELMKPCSDSGDPFYQFGLAIIYYNEHAMELIGKTVNEGLAFELFTKAAEQGYEDAILILMDAYERGDMGLVKDETQYKYWRKILYDVQKNMK